MQSLRNGLEQVFGLGEAMTDANRTTEAAITLRMTRLEALRLGLIYCESCGYPPNNHFLDQPEKLCAHTSKCTGYVEKVRYSSPPADAVKVEEGSLEWWLYDVISILRQNGSTSHASRVGMAIERLQRQSLEPDGFAGFVVADSGSEKCDRYRCWRNDGPGWTINIDDALQFARRQDAEAFAAEDIDGWRILPVPQAQPAQEPTLEQLTEYAYAVGLVPHGATVQIEFLDVMRRQVKAAWGLQ